MFKQIFFCVMSLLSVGQSLDGVKYYSAFLEKGNLYQLLVMGFFIVRACIKFMFILTVSKRWSLVKSVVASCTKLEGNNMRGRQVSWFRN